MIAIYDKNGDLRLQVVIAASDIYHKELMVSEYVQLDFKLAQLVRLRRGDYIDTEFGRFSVKKVDSPLFDPKTGAYTYEQKFHAGWEWWRNYILYYDRQNGKEKAWKMTQTAAFFMEIVKDNLELTDMGTFQLDVDASLTEMRLVEFDSTDIVAGLNKIAEVFESEWWVENNTLHLRRCEYGTSVHLSLNDTLSRLDRDNSQDTVYVTRLVAFGSTRNIPTDYRPQEDSDLVREGLVEKRLKLPVLYPHLDAWENLQAEEVEEGIVIFDDIYPRRTGTVENVSTKQYTDTIEHEDGTTTETQWNAYRFKDSGITFHKSYVLEGQELRIVFQTGKLAGMDFAVTFNPDGIANESDSRAQIFEIVRSDDYGVNLPNDSFHPEVDDTYILYGFDIKLVSDQYVSAAENELLLAARKWLTKNSEDKSVYTADTNKVRAAGYTMGANGSLEYDVANEIDLDVGQRVRLIDSNYFDAGYKESRVRMFEKHLDNKFNATYVIGNDSAYSSSAALESKVDALTYMSDTYITSEGGGTSLYVIKRNDATIASDFNVYSALRSKMEFVSKRYDDIVQGLLKFVKGATFGDFATGLTGFGGKIDGYGRGELESLSLRRFLEVPELRYNRVSIQVGNQWRAPSGGIIQSVTPDYDQQGNILMTGTITLHLEEGEIGTIAVDDICQGIYHDGMTTANNEAVSYDDGIGNFKFAGFFTSYFRVTEIVETGKNSKFRYALRPVSDTWTQTHHPCEAMHFVGYGNFTDTDRQTSRYSTLTYERFLTGVNDWEFTKWNIGAQFGDLSNLSVFGMNMTGYSAYLNNIYMSGTIQQFEELPLRMEIDTDGDSFLAYGENMQVTCAVLRGWEDLTSEVVRWTVTRDSGDAADDAAWALRTKVKNFNGTITLYHDEDASIDDLGNINVLSTLFTFRAYLEDGSNSQFQLTI